MVDVAQVFGQLNRGGKVAARVAGNQIRHQILLFAKLLIDLRILRAECVVYIAPGLTHDGEHLRAYVFRRNLQLATDVVLAKLLEERIGLIGHDVIIAKT